MAKNTTETPQAGNLGNGQVDSASDAIKESNKILVAKMKAIGLDSKGLYTEWNNGAVDADGNNGAVDMIDFMVSKKKLTTDDKSAILTMFNAMAKANAPKIKTVKPVPDELAETLAQTWYTRQQVLAQYNAAKLAVETLWAKPRDVAKTELDEACKAVIAAGLFVDRKTGKIKHTKSGSTTDGEHGNSGKVKLQYGTTITVYGKSYSGWKDLAKNLVTSVYAGETNTNYIQNTKILDELVKLDTQVDVYVKPTIVGETKEKALEAWETSTAKTLLDAHPSITVHVS